MNMTFKNSLKILSLGVTRIRKLKDRQHNGQKKKDRTNNNLQNIYINLKIE